MATFDFLLPFHRRFRLRRSNPDIRIHRPKDRFGSLAAPLVNISPMSASGGWPQPIDATFYSLAIERGMLKMKQRPRIYYSEAQKALMWERWQKGDSLHAIARFFDRGHSSVQRILSETGGIRPPQRKRSRLALTLSEREEISRGVVAGHSIISIAESLGRAP